MIVPKTADGRVVFMLPWLGSTIAGTTDAPAGVSMTPQAREADVQFVLSAIEDFLSVEVCGSAIAFVFFFTLLTVPAQCRGGRSFVPLLLTCALC